MRNNETSNPVVASSNLAGRAENPSDNPTQGNARQHGNTRVRPGVATQGLHGGSADPSPSPSAAEPSREHSEHAAASVAPLPEALRGYSDFARGFVEVTSFAPTPEQDRAIIRCARDALQAWDEWESVDREETIERLRDALVAAGYLAEVVDND